MRVAASAGLARSLGQAIAIVTTDRRGAQTDRTIICEYRDARRASRRQIDPTTHLCGGIRFWPVLGRMHLRNRGFAAVGFGRLGVGFNSWMYRVRRRILRRAGLSAEGATIFDVGAGTGLYVREWLKLGVSSVNGNDLSAAAVDGLQDEFPTAEFVREDIAEAHRATSGWQYDLVSAFDVLFHIIWGICYRSHRAGSALGAVLFLPELLTAMAREGPSTELVVCRRR
jgi:Methyltransferase domain